MRREIELGASVLEGAVALDSTSAPALLNLAAARQRQGKTDEAIALLERALVADPTYAKAQENLERYRASSKGASP